ncbi:MAG: TetR family transcriptional regulator [Solirubrobacterales bacterium]
MSAAAPAPGTRPRNRRTLVLAAARTLFAREGFAQVSMARVAAAVNVSAAALYRHFARKQELLAEVVAEALEHVEAQASDGGDDPQVLAVTLTEAVLARRELGVLWQREARALDPPARAALAQRLHALATLVAARLRAARDDLDAERAETLAWLALSVLASVAYHRVPDRAVARTLPAVLGDLFAAPVAARPPVPPESPRLRPRSRREQVLETAITLFAARGYAAVTLQDVGAAVGMAGPSVYGHFPDKEAILLAGLERGAHRLQFDLATVLRASATPRDALRGLTASYVDFAVADPDLVTMIVSESGHLSEPDRHRVRRMQREYVDEWVALLGPTEDDARVRVHAAITVVDDAARSRRWRDRERARPALVDLALRVLLGGAAP